MNVSSNLYELTIWNFFKVLLKLVWVLMNFQLYAHFDIYTFTHTPSLMYIVYEIRQDPERQLSWIQGHWTWVEKNCSCYIKLPHTQHLGAFSISEFLKSRTLPESWAHSNLHYQILLSRFLFPITLSQGQEVGNCALQRHNEGLWGQEKRASQGMIRQTAAGYIDSLEERWMRARERVVWNTSAVYSNCLFLSFPVHLPV